MVGSHTIYCRLMASPSFSTLGRAQASSALHSLIENVAFVAFYISSNQLNPNSFLPDSIFLPRPCFRNPDLSGFTDFTMRMTYTPLGMHVPQLSLLSLLSELS